VKEVQLLGVEVMVVCGVGVIKNLLVKNRLGDFIEYLDKMSI
jgi:hypothetical protein